MILTDEEQKLVDRLKELRPDLVVVPRKTSSIMALRGSQAGPVFEVFDNGEPADFAHDFFNFQEVPSNPQWDVDPHDYLNEDKREYRLVSAIWEGCISGLEEWERRRSRVTSAEDKLFVDQWDQHFEFDLITHPLPSSLKK